MTNLVSGLGGNVANFFAWGTGAGAASRTSTALSTEAQSTNNDGTHNTRPAGTVTRITTSQTNDTIQTVGTLTADTSKTITNIGLFDSNGQAANLSTAPSGGNLFLISDGLSYALNAGDSLQSTFKLQYT